MKKLHQLFPLTLGLVAFILALSSCNKMDDIQRKYAERAEQVYLGKVDSIVSLPGLGRAKLVWYISSDPKIDRTIIYWNMRKDSAVKEFNRTTAGVQKDSLIVKNLPEGTTLFEFRNVNKEGETSLYSSASVNVWGAKFVDGLRARTLTGFDFDYSQSIYNLKLSAATPGDSVVYSQINYKNAHGEEKTIKIERDTNNVKLEDFPDGGEFRFRTVFFSPKGIDTLINDYKVFKAPTAVAERGTKISFTGNMSSKYFDRNGETLYEWNAAGDIKVYTLNAGGELTQSESYSGIVPRATYRDFFFYDDDRFIGITAANAVSMHRIVDGKLAVLSASFGTGFTFPAFVPARGYFFSMTATSGEMKTWFARNDATWGSPNGVAVGTGFAIYNPLLMFNRQTLLGVDADGYLWSFPTSVSGVIGSKSRIGSGWNRFKKIISVGTTLFGMEGNGDFYVFENFNATDKYWVVN